jgi:hypothetical protein
MDLWLFALVKLRIGRGMCETAWVEVDVAGDMMEDSVAHNCLSIVLYSISFEWFGFEAPTNLEADVARGSSEVSATDRILSKPPQECGTKIQLPEKPMRHPSHDSAGYWVAQARDDQ